MIDPGTTSWRKKDRCHIVLQHAIPAPWTRIATKACGGWRIAQDRRY